MGKKKPDKVYQVLPGDGQAFYVIARHPKGALTIARAHGARINPSTPVRVVNDAYACQAVNARDHGHG